MLLLSPTMMNFLSILNLSSDCLWLPLNLHVSLDLLVHPVDEIMGCCLDRF